MAMEIQINRYFQHKPLSEYAIQVWTMVARRGMTPAIAARHLETSTWRVERILVGVSRRNATRW
jgi:hypothetical protein